MFHHQSAQLEYNDDRICNHPQMDKDWVIECWKAEYVFTHIQVAHLRFQNFELPHYHQGARVAFQAGVALAQVDVHLFHCASQMSAESMLWHDGNEGSHPGDFHKPLLGVSAIPVFTVLCPANSTPHLFSSRSLAWNSFSGVAFPLVWQSKTLLWPFCLDSIPGVCRTGLCVLDLLGLP